jgi:UDP-N-acetylmuramoyl-tripeptide--D-alanyl-D-alanine ligase
MERPAIFLDRDGVLNADHGYVYKVEDLVILDGVGKGLKRFQDLGYLLLVITNQSGVARGLYTLADVDIFNRALAERIRDENGVKLDDFFICPHHPDGSVPEFSFPCTCRKPKTGLIEQAVEKWQVDLGRSIIIGDKPSDIDLAVNANIPGIQISITRYGVSDKAAFQALDLVDAANYIEDNLLS